MVKGRLFMENTKGKNKCFRLSNPQKKGIKVEILKKEDFYDNVRLSGKLKKMGIKP
jgi:hypothetical protein